MAGCLDGSSNAESHLVPDRNSLLRADTDGWIVEPKQLNDPNATFDGPERSVAEAMVAVHPTDPSIMLVAAIDFNAGNPYGENFGGTRVFRSTDAGATWDDQGLVRFSDRDEPESLDSGDPVVLFDSEGTAYYAALAKPGGEEGIYVLRSEDDGATWGEPVLAVPWIENQAEDECRATDKEMLGHDPQTNRLYMTFTWFIYPCSSPQPREILAPTGLLDVEIYLTVSDDRGETWSEPQRIDDSYGAGSIPRVGPDGTLYVASYSTSAVPPPEAPCPGLLGSVFLEPFGSILVKASDDGGRSWRTHTQGVCDGIWVYTLSQYMEADGPPILSVIPSLSVDPADAVAYLAYLHYSYIDRRTTVMVTTSADGGNSWSDPVDVTPGMSGQHAFLPSIVAQNGTAWLFYLEKEGDDRFAPFLRHTSDEGQTWSAPLPVTEIDFHLPRGGDMAVGHYNWIDASDGLVAMAWAGSEDSTTDLWFRSGLAQELGS